MAVSPAYPLVSPLCCSCRREETGMTIGELFFRCRESSVPLRAEHLISQTRQLLASAASSPNTLPVRKPEQAAKGREQEEGQPSLDHRLDPWSRGPRADDREQQVRMHKVKEYDATSSRRSRRRRMT